MTYKRYLAIFAATIVSVTASAFLLSSPDGVQAQQSTPEIVYQNIEDGDTLGEQPFVLQMCFAEPINVLDLDKGGDFRFSLMTPANLGLGLRIVFQPDGYGVSIYPGDAPVPVPGVATPTGEPGWKWEYRVTHAESLEPLEGVVNFTVDEDADPVPQATPPVCVARGGTATPAGPTLEPGTPATFRPTRTPIGHTPDPTPTLAPGETAAPTEAPDDGEAVDDEDDDPDILLLALLTIGIIGALGGVAIIGFVIRRRVGFDPHKPGPGADDHH